MNAHQNIVAPQLGLGASLSKDAESPANAFHVNGAAVLKEGVEIALNHPGTGGQPALFVGERWFLRDKHRMSGCMYQPTSTSTALVRRMEIQHRDIGEGRKPLPLLVQPGENAPCYLMVNPTIEMAPGARMKVRFWHGVVNGAVLVEKSQQDMLISFPDEGMYVDVFYADGRMASIVRLHGTLVQQPLTLAEQAGLRLEQLRKQIDTLKTNDHFSLRVEDLRKQLEVANDKDELVLQELREQLEVAKVNQLDDADRRARTIDGVLHQAIDMMVLGGKKDDDVLDVLYEFFVQAGQKKELHAGVRRRVTAELARLAPAHALRFDADCTRRPSATNAIYSLPSHTPAAPLRKGPPQSRKAQLAARAERDRQSRSSSRGSSAEKPLHQGGGKKKK